jgi:transcriptional regulator with XRE-family HTH domain
MGVRRKTPIHLPRKLRAIRDHLGLSQSQLVRHLGLESEYDRSHIARFETGLREPPLYVVLRYARSVKISTDVLIDDEMDLPKKLTGRFS